MYKSCSRIGVTDLYHFIRKNYMTRYAMDCDRLNIEKNGKHA